MKSKLRQDYDFEIIEFMQETGQIDQDEALFMKQFVRGQAQ